MNASRTKTGMTGSGKSRALQRTRTRSGRRTERMAPPGRRRAGALGTCRRGKVCLLVSRRDLCNQLAFVDLPMIYRGDHDRDSCPAVTLRASFAGYPFEWQGRVVRTEGEIDAKSRMVTAVASIEDPYGQGADRTRPPLAVGLFVEAEIQGRRVGDASVLPRTALRGTDHVLVLDADSRLRLRKVDVLRVEREQVVIGAGLAPGERVCVSPLPGAVDGMQVRVVPTIPEFAELRR